MTRILVMALLAGSLVGCGGDPPAAPSRLDSPAPHVWGRPLRHYPTTIPTMP